ncbi:hypothetical protein [Pseudomonas aeruginosa]|uniref:hypothetical protein n=1 Tax=Pseudomonas aeruginosa TaxID=287 RepID=UPI000F7F9C42|nr:hypothetical protein [Pseudomonas aeruginosa]RTB44111.1 hypothetical protein EJ655_08210 [Pseudomonas aeruginosa]
MKARAYRQSRLVQVLCVVGLCAASGLVPAASEETGVKFRPLVLFTGDTGDFPGRAPSQAFWSNGKLYGATYYGGGVADSTTLLSEINGVFYSLTDTGTDKTVDQNAYSHSVASDVGRYVSFHHMNENGVLYGSRFYTTAVVAGLAQSAAFVSWDTKNDSSPKLGVEMAYVREGENNSRRFNFQGYGQWASARDGSTYAIGNVTGAEIQSTGIKAVHVIKLSPDVSSAGVALAFGKQDEIQPQVTVGDSVYSYYPAGSNSNAIVYSNDDGGTIYALSNNYGWAGDFPNSTIPDGQYVSGLIVSSRVDEIKTTHFNESAKNETPITALQALASGRDGVQINLAVHERGTFGINTGYAITSRVQQGLIEVGDYLYGTTLTTVWRYRKRDAQGNQIKNGAVEQVHAFTGGDNDGTSARGALVLAADGYVYGTTFSGGTGNSGTVFRFKPGNEAISDDAASYQLIHSFISATDGAEPQGLSIGPIVTNADGSRTQTLYGTAFAGGPLTGQALSSRVTDKGAGSIFAVDISLPAEAVTISKFVVDDQASVTVQADAKVTLAWEAEKATVCSLQGQGVPENHVGLPSDTLQTDVLNEAGTYIYTLKCSNATGQVSDPAEVTVTVEAVGGGDDSGDTDNGGTGGNTDNGATSGDSDTGGGGGNMSFILLALLAIGMAGLSTQRHQYLAVMHKMIRR